jgi:hypothetical protein
MFDCLGDVPRSNQDRKLYVRQIVLCFRQFPELVVGGACGNEGQRSHRGKTEAKLFADRKPHSFPLRAMARPRNRVQASREVIGSTGLEL